MKKIILFSVAFGLSVSNNSYAFNTKANAVNFRAVTHAALNLAGNSTLQSTITGKVTEGGQALEGVNVTVIGTNMKVKTDSKGQFSVVAAVGSTLRFSMVGYANQDVVVRTNNLNVSLVTSDSALEEVVVVGYGTQRKGNVTGAVSTISVKDNLESRPIADVGRAIQGTTPGLSVTIPSGEVGSDPTIKIRGQIGSLQGGSSPLILLDNVEIPSIQLLNPDDVESITVLKDAAASSIYGAKAAFGVVLITTKKGSNREKASVNYSNNFSFQNPFKKYEMGTLDALKYSVEAAKRAGSTFAGAFYKVNQESYERAVQWQELYGSTVKANDPTVYNRDWYFDPASGFKYGVRTYDPYEYMVKEWAGTQTHNVSVSGGTNKTTYNLGLGLLDQSGMLKPAKADKFSRYNASLRVESELNKYVTARAGVIYSQTNKQYPYATNSTTADPWLYLYRWSSLYPFGTEDNGRVIRGPEQEVAAANTASLKKNYLNFNLGTTVKLTDKWKVDFDYTLSNQEELWNRPGTRFTAANSWTAPVARLDASGNPVYVNGAGEVVDANAAGAVKAYQLDYLTYTANGSSPDHIYRSAENFYRHTINALTTYNLNLESGHDFKFIAGVNRVAERTNGQWSQITNLTDIINPQFNFAIGTQTTGGSASWQSQLGYFARLNYAFKNKYLFEGNIRYDGSSKFTQALWWNWFPSFSAGWVASEESFMEWTKPVLNQLKFRGSWGSIGDQSVSNGLYLATMSSGAISWVGGDGTKTNYVDSPKSVSRDVKWQTIQTLDVGVDARFLQNRLGVVFDWYQRDTKNMIVPTEGIPPTFGISAPQSNHGSLRTKGWELAVDFNHRFENGLGINLRGNVSDAKTKITKYGSTLSINNWYVGKTYGEIWGYETDRLYQKSDFQLDAAGNTQLVTLTADQSELYVGKKANLLAEGPNGENPVYQPFLQNSANFYFGPGDVKFKDLNGDGEINNGKQLIDDHGDLRVIGNNTPRYEYGFRLGADYKGIDFAIFFQGVGARQVWGDGFLTTPGFNSSDGAMPQAIAGNYWTESNTNAFYPAAYNNAGANTANNTQVQTRYLLDMSYLRIKNMTLGYALPKTLISKAGINTLRVYVSLENFVTWDKLKGLPIDPEEVAGVSMFNSSNYNSGRTGVGTPTFKSASFGVQLNF
ncbi:TonB-dependent receptor [Sphingobacteriaceae bacterium WQ 2009]|uniref:TonB-dependent receptor n=1 Tax=Rhinopithecimicrobium faecis TaxID=2820698 RepID=A0A8T4HDE4_9SPHI|nr:TonB-dependent receptor [Sphingobacteriaceae bacterium WQ 2009]